LCKAFAEVYFSGRYPGVDLEGAKWRDLRAKLEKVAILLAVVKTRLGTGP
jgi:hypothetical protein